MNIIKYGLLVIATVFLSAISQAGAADHNFAPWMQTRKCFGVRNAKWYTQPEDVYVCVDVSKECVAALDRYYAFRRTTFGCAITNGGRCPSPEELAVVEPPTYCLPVDYPQHITEVGYLPNESDWNDLRLRIAHMK